MMICANGLGIHFINDLSNETHYIYDVELENMSNSGVDYDMKNLYCRNGFNVLDLNEFTIPEGKTLLNEGHIVVGVDRVEGIVAFEKEVGITNETPVFEYDVWRVDTYIGGV